MVASAVSPSTPPPLSSQVDSPAHEIGDVVRVMDDMAEMYRLQKDHGGWNDDMALVRSSYTFVDVSPFTCVGREQSMSADCEITAGPRPF